MIGNDWDTILNKEYSKEYFIELKKYIINEYNTKTIYPKIENVLNAYRCTSYEDVKVVILGQDPYHEINQAEGLAFSVKEGIKIPPSLLNIFKELKDDLGYPISNSGSLLKWANEGILLLNTILTVEEHKPLSHQNRGWEIFTNKTIQKLNERATPIVFILWGSNARTKRKLISNKKHLILESSHPSPLSAYSGFFGSKPFSKTNKFLIKNNIKPINWDLN